VLYLENVNQAIRGTVEQTEQHIQCCYEK